MPVTQADIDQLRTNSQGAMGTALNAQAGAGTVKSELRDALASKLAENKPLIEGRNDAMAKYLSSGADARALYGDPESEGYIFNPWTRQKLIAGEQSLAYKPYADLTDYIGILYGDVQNLAKQGAANYNQYAQTLTNNATLAEQQYQNALNEYIKMGELDIAKQKAGQTGTDQTFANTLLQLLMGQGGNNTAVGEMPNFSPQANGVIWEQPDGSLWQFRDTRWVPYGG